MEDRALLEVVHRFLTDGEFRERWMLAPRETLFAELGVSRESYQALVAIVPLLVAGGLFVLSNGGIPGATGPSPNWGGWGRP